MVINLLQGTVIVFPLNRRLQRNKGLCCLKQRLKSTRKDDLLKSKSRNLFEFQQQTKKPLIIAYYMFEEQRKLFASRTHKKNKKTIHWNEDLVDSFHAQAV